MPKWKTDATEFSVSITYNQEKGSQTRIPKPILEKLGNPEKLTFVIDKDGKVGVESFTEWKKEQKRLRKEYKEIEKE